MAKARSGTSKARSTKSGKRTATRPTDNAAQQTREIEGGDSVLVVQFSEPDPLPPADIETFAANIIGRALATTTTKPVNGKAWPFFLATDRAHPTGQHCWLGVGAGVPA